MRAIPVLADTAALELEVLPPNRRLGDAMLERESARAFNRVLRVAISLRGGVSLAVWMAGALAELDLLRRIRIVRLPGGGLHAFVLWPDDRPIPSSTLRRVGRYARVVAAAGYDEVQFDVIAGASAGGLAAVLFAVAQRAGTSLDANLPVWRDLAGLQTLLQPPGLGSVEAPMRGDAYFWRTATRAVADLYSAGRDPARSHPDLVADRLSVHLSATVINSEAESEPDIREGRGHFAFRADDRDRSPQPNGIPAARDRRQVEPPEVQLLRLAYATRATSSLPGGFEVARVTSPSETRREALEASDALAPLAREAVAEAVSGEETDSSVFSPALRPDFAFAFSSHRPPRDTPGDTGPYEVIDGGIFDNVPIDRALRVIKATVGPTYGDRALLDLDPDPESRRRGHGEHPSREWVPLGTVLAAWLRRIQRRESAAEELEEVHRFNAEIMADQGRLEALASVVSGVDVAAGAAAERLRGYLRNAGGTDALFLVDAIARPSRWQLMSTLPRRRKLRALPAEQLTPLLPALMAAYAAAPDPVVRVERLPSALLDAANAVLGWVRAIEARDVRRRRPELQALETIREHVADALAFAHRARDAAAYRVLLLTSRYAAAEPDGPVDDDLVRLLVRAWQERARGEEGRLRQEREDGALASYHQTLDEDLRTLRRYAPDEDERDEAGVPWGATVWHAVHTRYTGRELRTVDLIALVAPAGMQPPMSVVATGRISADEQPAVPAAFPPVVAEERRLALQDAIAGRPAGAELFLTARAKLAGHGIGNLPGFLSEDWRTGDWWWGRLDGAAGMLRFLAARFPAAADPDRVDELVADAQAAIREEAGGDEPLRAGADGVGNLTGAYRTALATRTLSALLRSAAPAGGAAGNRSGGWKRWGFLALEALLRPLLLLLPLAASPVRLVVALGAVAGLGWGLTRTLEPEAANGRWLLDVTVAVLAVLGVLAAILVATRRGVRRWKALSSGDQPRPPGVTAEDSERARHTAARLSNAAAAVAAVAAALLGWSVAEGRFLGSAGWLLVAAGGAIWSIRFRIRVPLIQAPLAWPAVVGGVIAFAALAVGGPVLDLTVRLEAPVDAVGFVQLLAFAAVFSVVLVVGWEGLDKVVLALMAGAALWLLGALVLLLLPGEGTPGWIPPVAFLVAWSNTLWWALQTRARQQLPSDAPRRTERPRWFTDAS